MSCCDLDLLPLAVEHVLYIGSHVVTVCAKVERNRTIRGWVIDDLASLCRRFLSFFCGFSIPTHTNSQKQIWWRHRTFIGAWDCCFGFKYVALFRNERRGNASGVENRDYFYKLTAVRHLEFDRKWIFKILQSPGTNSAPSCQMSRQSPGNVRLG